MKVHLISIIACITTMSCNTGDLNVIADITNQLKEVSGVEQIKGSDLYWVIEDAGNGNRLYGLDNQGKIEKSIVVRNAKNIDWEDITSDKNGNIFIGDFGDNSRIRKKYSIYRVDNQDLSKESVRARATDFQLPQSVGSMDIEAFFIWNNVFYLFSKSNDNFKIFKLRNNPGNTIATLISEQNLRGKGNEITSADISNDGKTVILLNHDKLWKLTGYKGEDFFSGNIEYRLFGHSSQKEGCCFGPQENIIVTDENKGMGSNIYALDWPSK